MVTVGHLTEENQVKKKFLVFLIVLCTFCFTLGLAACSDNSEDDDTTPRIELPAETLELEVGQTAQITPVVKNAEGTVLWQSSAPAVASVDQTGLITANAVGESVVTAFIDSTIFNDITVTVVAKGDEPSITFSSDSYTMSMYDNLVLSPTFVQCSETPVWSSSDESVATVESNGNVIPHGFGRTQITVACGEISATVSVTVEETAELPTLSFNREELELLVGGELTIEPVVRFGGREVTGFTAELTSLDPSVATVSGGKVNGISAGETQINVRVSYRGYDFAERAIPVVVKDDVNIVLSSNAVQLYTKEIDSYDYKKTQQITAEIYVSGIKENDATVTWSAKDDAIAGVSSDGTISAKSAGTTTITATYSRNGETYTATVNADVVTSVATYERRELVLSSQDSFTFDIPFESGETFVGMKIGGNGVAASAQSNAVTAAASALTPYYGEQEVRVETDRAIYVFPTLIITKALSTMDDLKSIVYTAGNTMGGYFILADDIQAGNDVDFRLLTVWSNVGNAGFVGTFDGRGHGIYGLNIHQNGLFNCIGAAGVVKNLALVDVTGTDFAIATECRGTVDNVFVTSETKESLVQMSDDSAITNSFAILSAEGSNVVGTIYSATCVIKNVYGYAGGMIRYTDYSQAAEPTIFASTDVARLRAELATKDLSGYDTEYWKVVGGTPVFASCESLTEAVPEIALGEEYMLPAGQAMAVTASGYAAISLKTPVEGVLLEDGVLTLTKSAEVTFVATGLWGTTAEKTVKFTVVDGEMFDRTDEQLFDYELGADSVTFTLPQDISDVVRLSVGTGAYAEKGEGFTLSEGKVTIEKALLESVSKTYGDYEITLTDGTDYYTYACSFVTKIIKSLADLESIRTAGDTLDGYFILGQSFTANNDTAMQKLIGAWSSDANKGFVGIFDGRGYSITGLRLTNQGLFRCMGRGVVRNLALIDVYVEGVETDTAPAPQYTVSVFGDADCQSTTFENLFISTNAKGMIHNTYGNITMKNIVFVTSAEGSGYLSNSGANSNGGSYTIENALVVGTDEFRYYGGTPVLVNTAVYDSAETLLAALDADSFAGWGSSFSFADGKLLFGGVTVLG